MMEPLIAPNLSINALVTPKTVYVLGAGFSKSAGAPLQSEIIHDIFSLTLHDIERLDFSLKDLFLECKHSFEYLLKNIFFMPPKHYKYLSLEDIYSSIDKSILSNLSLRNISKKDLQDFRQRINALIIILMKVKLPDNARKKHIRKFANRLVKEKSNDPEVDQFAIISTNWDIILENALRMEIDLGRGDIDYCFYTHSYREFGNGGKIRSGQYLRSRDIYNLKFIKLHGSMNWLQCQKCQKVYITYFEKIALDEFLNKPKCIHCTTKDAYLSSVLIMPTFLKNLSNHNLKLSWQNAGIELQTASKIVFMGYSLPMADFELRHLLTSSIREDAEIEVVLHSTDKPKIHNYRFLPEYRYKSFLGKRKIKFYYDGVEGYINTLIPDR